MPTALMTDAYKLSMAEAGWPLRTETFAYTHRRGGPHYLPFDVSEVVRGMLPSALTNAEQAFVGANGYFASPAIVEALSSDALEVHALPAHSWFGDREPAFTITGPSALVSWLEPLVLQLHFRIQVATAALRDHDRLEALCARVSCRQEATLIEATLDAIGVAVPPLHIDPAATKDAVRDRAALLLEITGDPSRVFEVGMRAASCPEHHALVVEACAEAGLLATSNIQAARELGIRAVGTMGHEHVQRYGSDEAAFRAMRDRRPGPTSFLLDTLSTIDSGIPTALRLLQEEDRGDTMRFDSGDKVTQYRTAVAMARQVGIEPRLILEDGFDATLTRRFEMLRDDSGLAPQNQRYGYGGYLVDAERVVSRSHVAAVWKLSESGGVATMKWADAPGGGKESIPGRPVLWQLLDGRRMIAQQGEPIPNGFQLTDAEQPAARPAKACLLSPQTRALRQALYQTRTKATANTATATGRS